MNQSKVTSLRLIIHLMANKQHSSLLNGITNMWTTGVDIVERGLCSVWNNALDMWEKYVGWMVTNESGGRQAERDEGKERRWRMWAGWAQSFRTGSKNVLTLSQNPRRGGRHLYKEWNYESFQNPDLTVFECVWMRQRVKAVLLMRIWKSNHRLWLRRLGSAVLNDTLPLHKTKANQIWRQDPTMTEMRHTACWYAANIFIFQSQNDLCEYVVWVEG